MNPRSILIHFCVLLSGAAGLVYEVVWSRQLSLFLGTTSQANTAVITAYMLGLAAGSWWIGRRSDQLSHPLRAYAWVELGIGLFAATTPWLFTWLQSAYTAWAGEAAVAGAVGHAARFTIALAALLIPTFLMGGTLPLLVRGVVQQMPQLGAVTGRLYGINTIGATLGTALTGFVLLPGFGINFSILAGVVANFVAASLIVFLVPREKPAPAPVKGVKRASTIVEEPQPLTTLQGMVLLSGFAVTGFASLLTQLAWMRSMVLMVGGSVYAFTITLTSFLAGIGLGSLMYARWLSRRETVADRFRLAAILAFLAGLMTLASLSLIARLPTWFLAGYEAGLVQDFTVYQAFMFALCGAVMLPATLAMGALFPLLAVSWAQLFKQAGRGIGDAYAVNTVGTIAGALFGGIVLLQWLGIHYSIVLTSSLYALVAIAYWASGDRRWPAAPAGAAALFMAAVWLTPAWNREQATYGVYQQPELKLEAVRSLGLEGALNQNRLLYYKEGLNGTVAVIDNGYQLNLAINGKVDASSRADLDTQISLSMIGALLRPNARDALVIGLGSGISAGALATRESIRDITVLEISPEVIAAAEFFSEHNHEVLQDPKVTVIPADARNFLLASDRQWSLIVSEPSNPWISGISNLFTEEFFRLMKRRLAPGGVAIQWLQFYQITVEDLQTVLKSFSDNYRDVTVWRTLSGDLILAGSDQPQAISMRRLEEAFRDRLMGPELHRAGYATGRDLLLRLLFDDQAVRKYVTRARPNTDDHPILEFNAPRSLYAGSASEVLANMIRFTAGRHLLLPLTEQFDLAGPTLSSHTMGLEVTARVGLAFFDAQSKWWLWLMLQPGGKGVGVSDLRQLSWLEGEGLVNVQAVRDTYAPTADQRSNYLFNNLTIPSADFGALRRAGDADAQWMLGIASAPDRFELLMFWTCPSADGGSNWYIVSYQSAGLGYSDPESMANSFADRFLCSSAGSG